MSQERGSPLASVLLLTTLGSTLIVAGFMMFPRTDLGMLCGALILVALLIGYARMQTQRLSGVGILLVVMQLACALAVATGALAHLAGVGGAGRSFEAGFALAGIVAVVLATVYLRPRLTTMPHTAALALVVAMIVGVGSTARLHQLAASLWWVAMGLAATAVVASMWVRERGRLPAATYLLGLEALGLGALGFVLSAANADAIRLPGEWLDFVAGLLLATANAAFLAQHARSSHQALVIVAVNLTGIGVAAMLFSLALHFLPEQQWPVALGATLLAAGAAGWYWSKEVKVASRTTVVAMTFFMAGYSWAILAEVKVLVGDSWVTPILGGAVVLALTAFLTWHLNRGWSRERNAIDSESDRILRVGWLRAIEAFGAALAGAWMLIVYCCIFAVAAARWGPADLLAAVEWILPASAEPLFVRTAFRDRYLWHREAAADAPQPADGKAIRLPRARQDRFSYVASSAAYAAWFLERRFVGMGIGFAPDRNGATIAYVVKGSPADRLRLRRGQRVIAVNGRITRDLIASGDIGSGEIGAVLELTIADSVGNQGAIRLQSAWVEEREPIIFDNFLRDGRRVGYLFARNLNDGTERAILSAITALQYRDVSELVLDLRYASSGSSGQALRLASLIAGKAVEGKVVTRIVHNESYRDLDHEDIPAPPQISLDLALIVIITGPATCGAAEWLINGLKPHVRVVTVGAKTCGRPIGTEALQFRDEELIVATSRVLNAKGEGEYFQGIPPQCPAADDLSQPLGNPDEAALREALRFLATGSCSEGGQQRAVPPAQGGPPPVSDLRAVIGLY